MNLEITQRKSIYSELDDTYHKEHDFIEVTEWANGEGWDITISDKQQFSLHHSEFQKLRLLIDYLDQS